MVAGLSDISLGVIVLDGREVANAGPDRGIVFQAPSLVPWLTDYENVALGVEQVYPHASRQERRDIVGHFLERVGLADAADKKAAELSNGMKQRVGIARAFALSPKLLLLDEITEGLAPVIVKKLGEVIIELKKRGFTIILVEQNFRFAAPLADRHYVLEHGEIIATITQEALPGKMEWLHHRLGV